MRALGLEGDGCNYCDSREQSPNRQVEAVMMATEAGNKGSKASCLVFVSKDAEQGGGCEDHGWAASSVVTGWAVAATVVATNIHGNKRTGDCSSKGWKQGQQGELPCFGLQGCRARGSDGWEVSDGHRTMAGSGGGSDRGERCSRRRYVVVARLETRAIEVSCPISVTARREATGDCGCDTGEGTMAGRLGQRC
ncbi:hypothetical protein C4D60_Mb07t11050 [Musa balbisiana]|uniref:Uncharacterized protein n=1 Tax=Musa balbisiana TaxID=52838 RepID=A0A4S8JFP3_MUSBA|nr:hypothetical protein C4D60_Mb07t11050 [Musa balbisiana]